MENVNFEKFLAFWKELDEVHYVPHLVYSQDNNCDDNKNINIEVLNDIEELNGDLVACWQFDTACFGDLENVGTNNGNYMEITTVRVYDNGDERGDHVLVTSHILSDFHNGSEVEMWRKGVSPQKIFEILEELKKTQRELYSR